MLDELRPLMILMLCSLGALLPSGCATVKVQPVEALIDRTATPSQLPGTVQTEPPPHVVSHPRKITFESRKLLSLPELQQIKQIICTPDNSEVIILSSRGAISLSMDTLQVTRRVTFALPKDAMYTVRMQAVDLDDDKKLEYVQSGGDMQIRDLIVFNNDGSLRWRCPIPLEQSGFGGINWVLPVRQADNSTRLFVGSSSDDDAYQISSDGRILSKSRWGKICVYESVAVKCDLDDNGADEIIYSLDNNLYCRSAVGDLLWTHALPRLGTFINGVTRTPMLDHPQQKGFCIAAARGEEAQSDAYFRLSLNEPYVKFVAEGSPENERLLANVPITDSAGKFSFWAGPMFHWDEKLGTSPRLPDSIGVRIFDSNHEPLDGIPSSRPRTYAVWATGRPRAAVKVANSSFSGLLVANLDWDVWLFTFKELNKK
ncbi:MAG: hypothetical protein H7210_06665 [Pyrinomonadaceae bacterium]|nr:hypothetical protein [Phycisphaerales bacterium]